MIAAKPRATQSATGDESRPDESPLDKSEPRRMLSLEEVLKIVPVSPVTLWRMEKDELFPKGTFISANKKIWFADEVRKWQDQVDGRGRGRRHHPPAPKS
jgi:prophage regulatory protein